MMKAFVNMVRLTTHDAASRDAIRQAVDIMIPTLAANTDRGTAGAESKAEDHMRVYSVFLMESGC